MKYSVNEVFYTLQGKVRASRACPIFVAFLVQSLNVRTVLVLLKTLQGRSNKLKQTVFRK
jgi:hypothetical protein